MVHALSRARQHLRRGGTALLIQPHQHKRVRVGIAAGTYRHPVTAMINSEFQPRIDAANAAIHTALDEGLFQRVATSHHDFKVRLKNPTQLRDYLHLGTRPPRFPPGGRQRFQALWKARPSGAEIELTEYLTIISLRAI
jgi:hypothetical protein